MIFAVTVFERSGEDEQADAGYVEGFGSDQVLGALTQLGHADVGIAAQFQTGGDEHAVNFKADGTGEFKTHLRGVGAGQAAG